jgi:iron complex transport system substrate-binding protein
LAADPGPPLRVAAWDGAGFTARKGSLYDTILRTAGAINVINEPPAASYGTPDAEVLLLAAPDLIVQGAPGRRREGLRQDVARHPIVRKYWRDRTLILSPSLIVCGTPMSAQAAIDIRRQMRAMLAAVQVPLPFAHKDGP